MLGLDSPGFIFTPEPRRASHMSLGSGLRERRENWLYLCARLSKIRKPASSAAPWAGRNHGAPPYLPPLAPQPPPREPFCHSRV